MRTALIALALGSIAAAAPQETDAVRMRARTPASGDVIRGIHGEVLGPASTPDTTLGGSFHTPGGAPWKTVRNNIYEFTIERTGTGWEEVFLVGVPESPVQPTPVLCVFHAYAEDPYKVLRRTTYFRDAMERGWLVVAPLSAHRHNFGIEYAQHNTELVLDWMAQTFAVDPERFYAIGFSMGGGIATSYVARHHDPGHARFAALVNHTGTTSLLDVWLRSANKGLLEHELMFGGPPTTFPWDYSHVSAMDYDGSIPWVDPTTDMARNLSHVRVRNFYAAGDNNTYLVDETDTVHARILHHGGNSILKVSPAQKHKWWTMNEKNVLDWLEPITLTPPAPDTIVRTLADRRGRWHHFDLTQRAAGAYSPFRWKVATADNRLWIDQVENVERITFDTLAGGLDPALPLEVAFQNVDGGLVEIEVLDYPVPPTTILRNGAPSGAWSYDSQADSVILFESDSTQYPVWTIAP